MSGVSASKPASTDFDSSNCAMHTVTVSLWCTHACSTVTIHGRVTLCVGMDLQLLIEEDFMIQDYRPGCSPGICWEAAPVLQAHRRLSQSASASLDQVGYSDSRLSGVSVPSSWGRLFAADITILQQQDSSFRNQPCEMPIHSTKAAQHLGSLMSARYQLA